MSSNYILTRLLILTWLIIFCENFALCVDDKPASPEKNQERLDSYGDRLPPGAIARLGTLRFYHGGPISGVALAPNGKIAATAGRCDGNHHYEKYEWPTRDSKSAIFLWDLETGKRLLEIKLPNNSGSISRLVFSPDNQMLAAGCDRDVAAWSVTTGKELYRVKDHDNYVALISFSDDGKTLISGALFTGLLRYTDASTGKFLRSINVWKKEDHIRNPISSGRYEIEPKSYSDISNKICYYIGEWSENTINHQQLVLIDPRSGKQIVALENAGDAKGGGGVLSRDGKILVSSGKDRRSGLYLWNAETGAFLRQIDLLGSGMYVNRVVISPNGKYLISSHHDHWIRVWEINSGKLLRRYNLSASDFVVSDTTILVGTNEGCLRVIDMETGKEKYEFLGHRDSVQQIQFDTKNGTMLSISDGRYCCWDTASWKELIHLEHRQPLAEEYDSTSKHILSSDGKKYIRILDTDDHEREVSLHDASTGKCIQNIGSTDWRHINAQFTTDSKRVLISHDTDTRRYVSYEDERVKQIRALYDTSTGNKLSQLRLDLRESRLEVKLSPDGNRLISVDEDNRLCLCNLNNYKVFSSFKYTIHNNEFGMATRPQTSTNSAYLAAFCDDEPTAKIRPRVNRIHVYELGTLLEIGSIEIDIEPDELAVTKERGFSTDKKAEINSMAISPDGRYLAVNRRLDTYIRIFDVLTGKEQRRLHGHSEWIASLEFSPDGKILASGGNDTTVLVWDIKDLGEPMPLKEKLTDQRCCALWKDLDSDDPLKAGEAIHLLSQSAQQSVPLLQEKLKPIVLGKEALVARLITELDSEDYKTREMASKELATFGDSIESALNKALKADASAEQRRRLIELLAALKITAPAPEQLRDLRAIKVLEYAATPDARALLRSLAEGSPDARLTKSARDALQRLNYKGAK